MVPYNHDEWAWGTQEGIENLHNFFQGYNGRYFGDILAILITRSNLFKAFVMTASTIGVYSIMNKFYLSQVGEKRKKKVVSIITLLLLILVPTDLFRQIYGWPAAFINFVPPVIFVILYFYYLFNYIVNEELPMHPIIAGVFGILGTQFFSENITIYMFILTFSFLIIERIMNNRTSLFTVTSVVTSFIGMFLMFINPAYSNAAKNTDGYKKIELSFNFIWNKISSQIIPNMILNYKILLFIFNLGIIILILRSGKTIWNRIIISFIIFYTVYGCFFYGKMSFSYNYDASILNVLSIVYFIFLIIAMKNIFTGKVLLFYAILFISIPMSAAPLIVAEPIGPRSFYLTYCLWLLLTGAIYLNILEEYTISRNILIKIIATTKIIIVSVLIFYFVIFSYMYRVQNQREQIIQAAIKNNDTEIVLPLLPNENYTWKTSTGPGNWLERFKKFHSIPEETNVLFK